MTASPIFLLTHPRSRAHLLGRLLTRAGAHFATDVSLAKLRRLGDPEMARAALTAKAPPGVPIVVRDITFGGDQWPTQSSAWSWLLETWPEGRIVFLHRDMEETEISMEFTWPRWVPSYGKCISCCWRRVRRFIRSAQDFAEINPSRVELVDSAVLLSYRPLAATFYEVPMEAWEEEIADVRARWQDAPPPPVPVAVEAPAGPVGGALEKVGPVRMLKPSAAVPVPADYQPQRPFKFREEPSRHPRAIVYPWLSTAAVGEELRYSLRSIEAHFTDRDCPIYILGDRAPAWLLPGGRVRHIEIEGYLRSRRRGMFQATTLGMQLADEVMWMNDDIYLLRETGWDDLRVALTEGELTERAGALLASENGWQKGRGQAAADVMAHGVPRVMCFASHTPYLFQRNKSLEILRKFRLPYKGFWETAYHNYHGTPHRPVGDWKTMRLPASPAARYLNHIGHGPDETTAAELLRIFPTSAPWEDPATVEPTLELVIMTSERQGAPHEAAARAHHPTVHVHRGRDGATPEAKRELWRNCDRSIRDWWKANRHRVKSSHVAFVEWDVVVNADLREGIRPFVGLAGRVVENRPGSAWQWWQEIDALPENLRVHAASLRPLAVVIASRQCLEAISAPTWDDVFRRDIFCELRLPTVARACGFQLAALPCLAHVEHFPIPHPGTAPGVWHQVKT
jgi:hypothetical protein